MAEDDKEVNKPIKYVSNEVAAIPGRIIGSIIFAAALTAAYFFWPTGLGDIPLSQLTLGMIGEAIGCAVVVGIGFLLAALLW